MDFFSFCEGIYPFKCDVEGCETALTSPYKLKEHKEVHDNRISNIISRFL
jgi:hypothetical protein